MCVANSGTGPGRTMPFVLKSSIIRTDGRSVSIPVGAMIVASGGGSGKGVKPKQEKSTATPDPGKGK